MTDNNYRGPRARRNYQMLSLNAARALWRWPEIKMTKLLYKLVPISNELIRFAHPDVKIEPRSDLMPEEGSGSSVC